MREGLSIIGHVNASPAMQPVLDAIERVARTDATVLITGETGTGKSIIARIVHDRSAHANDPFITINCAALPEPLLERELFGHLDGRRACGTVLLDEISELSPALQTRLLRVLESPDEIRVIASTHRDLHRCVADGTFRKDLLFRIEVVTIELPPLRERRSEIPALLQHFLARARARHPHSRVAGFSNAAITRLCDHDWPGNIRELAHVVERCVLLSDRPELAVADLPRHIRDVSAGDELAFRGEVIAMREVQRRYARWAFQQLGSQKGRTATKLDIDLKTLNRWLSLDDE